MENLVSQIFSDDIANLLKPLAVTGQINCFSHSRIFHDGSRAEVWSDWSALSNTYLKTNYTTRTHAPSLYGEDERYIFLLEKINEFDRPVKENYEKHLAEQRELFNHDNTLIVRGNDPICMEFFCFYGPRHEAKTKTFIVNNIDKIEAFVKNYKNMAERIIKLAEEERIVKPWIDIDTIRIELTKREKDVAQLLTYNLSARNIAELLDLKSKTVEGYIEKIKDKYLCSKKKELVAVLRKDSSIFL